MIIHCVVNDTNYLRQTSAAWRLSWIPEPSSYSVAWTDPRPLSGGSTPSAQNAGSKLRCPALSLNSFFPQSGGGGIPAGSHRGLDQFHIPFLLFCKQPARLIYTRRITVGPDGLVYTEKFNGNQQYTVCYQKKYPNLCQSLPQFTRENLQE